MKWSDSVKRGVRTFFQSFVGIFIATLATNNVVDVHGVPHMGAVAALAMAAAWGAFIALLTWLQNALENKNVIPALGKDTPPSP